MKMNALSYVEIKSQNLILSPGIKEFKNNFGYKEGSLLTINLRGKTNEKMAFTNDY